jgi:hypothetical protein
MWAQEVQIKQVRQAIEEYLSYIFDLKQTTSFTYSNHLEITLDLPRLLLDAELSQHAAAILARVREVKLNKTLFVLKGLYYEERRAPDEVRHSMPPIDSRFYAAKFAKIYILDPLINPDEQQYSSLDGFLNNCAVMISNELKPALVIDTDEKKSDCAITMNINVCEIKLANPSLMDQKIKLPKQEELFVQANQLIVYNNALTKLQKLYDQVNYIIATYKDHHKEINKPISSTKTIIFSRLADELNQALPCDGDNCNQLKNKFARLYSQVKFYSETMDKKYMTTSALQAVFEETILSYAVFSLYYRSLNYVPEIMQAAPQTSILSFLFSQNSKSKVTPFYAEIEPPVLANEKRI